MIRKMRDYPRELVIGENVWRIKFHRKLPDTNSLETLGFCNPSDHEILIQMGQTPRERFKTLIHELLHAFEYEYGFEMSHATVARLEEPIARLLLDNGIVF